MLGMLNSWCTRRALAAIASPIVDTRRSRGRRLPTETLMHAIALVFACSKSVATFDGAHVRVDRGIVVLLATEEA
ncbi:hypothetical protein HYQ46_011426 [Verticillium longisporum]|nr:hypothetical protein HYQ46_011426 [Verticillium longisporum]KAG7116846.1 hypothetical protein HYQ44_006473 [Verticillium longisporum]